MSRQAPSYILIQVAYVHLHTISYLILALIFVEVAEHYWDNIVYQNNADYQTYQDIKFQLLHI